MKMAISRVMLTGIVVSSSALLSSACSQQPQAAAPPFNKNSIQEFADLMQQRDDDKASKMFTEDAKLMPPDSPMIEGRAAIRVYLHDLFGGQAVPTELAERDEFTSGVYTFRDGILTQHLVNGSTQIGKFMQVWKYVDGKWEQHRVIWNLNASSQP
jgi:ketosteroid isomerase-like protein